MAHGDYTYIITFTDDLSRYRYLYLMRYKSESFEKFKEFKAEVENQTCLSIKALRSDRGGEHLSRFIEDSRRKRRIELNEVSFEQRINQELVPVNPVITLAQRSSRISHPLERYGMLHRNVKELFIYGDADHIDDPTSYEEAIDSSKWNKAK
eukprot:XP_015575458.1 uncharacterized protein LOC107261346 [Ricinus communis]